MGARLAVQPLEGHASETSQIRPVSGEVHLFKRRLLLTQLFLRQVCNRHVAGVDSEPWLRRALRGTDVVMRSAAVLDNKIAGLYAHFLPLATSVGKPLQPSLRETVPLFSPCPDLRLVDKLFVEFFGKKMCAFAHDQAAIVGSVRQKVHKTLETAEAWLQRVLVLVRLGLVDGELFAVWKREIDGVEAHGQVVGGMYFLEGTYDTRLLAYCPRPRLVGGTYGPSALAPLARMRGIPSKLLTITEDHALLADHRKIILVDC